jgi:hypothetical protein
VSIPGAAIVLVNVELEFFSVVSLVFKSNPKTSDCHDDMNIEDEMRWLNEILA